MPLSDKERELLMRPVNLDAATKIDPDIRAESLRISTNREMPLSVVENNLDELRRREKVRNAPQLRPKLTEFMRDPENASISHDDIDPLNNIERLLIRRYSRHYRLHKVISCWFV